MNQKTSAPAIQVGAASYPPAYYAPSAVLDREYRAYITARVKRDEAAARRARFVIDATLDRKAGV